MEICKGAGAIISRYDKGAGRCVLAAALRAGAFVFAAYATGRVLSRRARAGDERRIEQLRRECGTDMLTGLLNRRGGQEKAETMLAMCRRCEKPMAVLMADIDHFKEYNDAHGHLAGDAVLRHVANVILSRVNIADTLVRYGGDEFVLLLSHIPPEKFRSILERIRGAVYTTEIPQYENIHPTVSIGGVYQAHPLVEAIRRADKLMYWAKQKRNDVQT